MQVGVEESKLDCSHSDLGGDMIGQGWEGAYLPGGEPKMRETTASLAILMFCTDPRMWMWL